MELETMKELLEEKKLTEIKKELNEMNEYDIADLIEDLPENQLLRVNY